MQFSGVSHRKKENKNARKVYFGKAGDLREREISLPECYQ